MTTKRDRTRSGSGTKAAKKLRVRRETLKDLLVHGKGQGVKGGQRVLTGRSVCCRPNG